MSKNIHFIFVFLSYVIYLFFSFLHLRTYNAFNHLQCFPTYTLYIYLCLVLFKCNHFYAFQFTFGSHWYTIPNTHISYQHIIWFFFPLTMISIFFLRYIEKKHTTTMQFINKCFSLHVIDLLHLSSHVFILFYIFPFFNHFPSLYVPWKQKLPCPTYNILFL